MKIILADGERLTVNEQPSQSRWSRAIDIVGNCLQVVLLVAVALSVADHNYAMAQVDALLAIFIAIERRRA